MTGHTLPITLAILLCYIYSSYGHDDDDEPCGTDLYNQELFELHPEYKTHMEIIEPEIHTAVENILHSGKHPFLKRYDDTTEIYGNDTLRRRMVDTSEPQINIRVFFHIFYAQNRPWDNVDDDTLREAIETINIAWNGEFQDDVDPIWRDRVGSAKINWFSDIPNDVNRVIKEDDWTWEVTGSYLTAERELKLESEGGSDGVDMDTTMNVWVAPTDDISAYSASIPLFTGCFEYSQNNFGFEAWRDGLFLRRDLLGGPTASRRGSSFPHEAGHYLGLWHPWRPTGSCSDGNAGAEPGDGVDDTPVTWSPGSGSLCDPVTNTVLPANQRDSCTADTERDMWENIMDYYTTCRFMFTEGQATLSRVVLENCRPQMFEQGAVEPEQLDPWIYVIDVSLSMQNDIDAVIETSLELLDILVDENKDPEYYVLTLFQNPKSVEPAADTYFITQTYGDSDDFIGAVSNVETEGGTFCDESSFSGINDAVETALDRGSSSGNIFVFTDANKRNGDLEPSDILPKLIGDGNSFRVNFILSYDGGCVGNNVDPVYSEVASATNGFIIPSDNDAIQESVEIVKDFLIYSDQVPIVQIETDSDTATTTFDVDPGIVDLIIVISGDFNSNPSYTSFTDGNGNPVADRFTIQTVDGSGFQKVLVTLNPQLTSSEEWTINVSFDNSRRLRRLLNAKTNKLNIYSGDPTISVNVVVSNIDDNYQLVSTSTGYLYYDEDGSFVVYASSGTNKVISITEISILSPDYLNSVTRDGNEVYYDAINDVYYAVFDFSELDGVVDVNNNDVFRVRTIGKDSNNNPFMRIGNVATRITDILITLDCDDALFYSGTQTSCTVYLKRNDGSTSQTYDLSANINNRALTIADDVTLSFVTDPITFSVGQLTASTQLNILISSNPDIIGEIFSLTVGVTNYAGSTNYDVVSPLKILRDWCPKPCSTDPCQCNEVKNCKICHPNGCDECHAGYFKKDYGHSCESCSDTFGDNCMFCQDHNGCGQCKSGSTRTYDHRCGLWYCDDGSNQQSSGNTGVIINLNSNNCPMEQYKCSNDGTSCKCDEVINCNLCNPGTGTGCDQCNHGYFKVNSNYNCAHCQEIFGDKCLFCQDFNGCGQCKTGCDRVYDSQCGVYVCNCST